MISTQPTHTALKKGGDCRIQFIVKLTEQPMLIIIIIWFYKLRGIINSSSTVNPNIIHNPGKCIMYFLKLRTRFTSLHPEIDNFFHQFKRRIRVKKLTLDI
jgi:hypothetical protein